MGRGRALWKWVGGGGWGRAFAALLTALLFLAEVGDFILKAAGACGKAILKSTFRKNRRAASGFRLGVSMT